MQAATRSRLLVTIPGREAVGVDASLEDVQKTLSSVHRLAATGLITQLLAHLDLQRPQEWVAFERAVLRRHFLRPSVRQRVETCDPRDPGRPRVVFHREQLLAGLALAQHSCPDLDTGETDSEISFLLGDALLGITDLLEARSKPSSDPGIPGVGASLLSYFAESNPPDPHLALLRTSRLVSRPEWDSDPVLSRFRERFQETVGLTLREYLYALVGAFGRLEALHPLEEWQTRGSWQEFTVDELTVPVRAALAELAVPFADLPQLVPKPQEVIAVRSNEPFRSRGLISFPGDRFRYVDYTIFAQQTTNWLPWRLIRLAKSDAEREALLSSWGSLVEGYVHELFEGVLGKEYVPSPTDDRNNEITDALVDYGDEVVLIEIKASILRHDVKYSNDVALLEKELRRKFVKEAQLARALFRLFGPERLGEKFLRRMRKSGLYTPSVVYPVLVTDDASLAAHGVESFLGDLIGESLRGVSYLRDFE